MTTKNLNRTNRDIILSEYISDLATNASHPVRYLIFDKKFTQDIFYEIHQPVDPEVLKRALNQYIKERGNTIHYQNDVLKVWPRKSDSGSQPVSPEQSQ